MPGLPVEQRREPRPAVEVSGVAPSRSPLLRRDAEVRLEPPRLALFLEPVAHAGPLPQQRLVRHLDGAVVGREQARLDEGVEHLLNLCSALRQFGGRQAAPDSIVCVARSQAQHEGSRDQPAVVAQTGVGRLGEPSDSTAHSAGGPVVGEPQCRSIAAAPEVEQRRGEKWQATGLAGDVPDESRDEGRLDLEVGTLGRNDDRPFQLLRLHRADEDVAAGEETRKGRVGRTASVEVGPQCNRHDAVAARIVRDRGERVDERHALVFVSADGEQLLELIDGDDIAIVERVPQVAAGRLELYCGMGARPHDHDRPLLAPGQRARGERPQEPCAKQR